MNELPRFGLFFLAFVPGAAVFAQAPVQCDFEAERNASIDAAGVQMVDISVGPGSLRVVGRQDLSEVRISGQACASSQELLDSIELEAQRRGDVVQVEADTEGGFTRTFFRRTQFALLNLVIEVPAALAADIDDGSGSVEVEGIRALTLDDGSGSISVDGITGGVRIDDGSGAIDVKNVGGDVEITDGSGAVALSDVAGSIGITDGSGAIAASDIGGNVTVHSDGSGGISATNVDGDFVVERDGSGGVAYRNIGGSVRTARAD